MGNFIDHHLELPSVVLYLPAPADSVGIIVCLNILQLLLKVGELLQSVLIAVGLSCDPGRAPFQLIDLFSCSRQLDFKGADLGSLSSRSIAGTFSKFLKLRHEVSLPPGIVHETLSVEVLKANSLRSDFRMALSQSVKCIFQLLEFFHQLINFPSEVSNHRL